MYTDEQIRIAGLKAGLTEFQLDHIFRTLELTRWDESQNSGKPLVKCELPPCSNAKLNTLAGFRACACGWCEADGGNYI